MRRNIPLERVERSSEAPEASALSAELQGHMKLVYHTEPDSAKFGEPTRFGRQLHCGLRPVGQLGTICLRLPNDDVIIAAGVEYEIDVGPS
jgi:hypothetical protein